MLEFLFEYNPFGKIVHISFSAFFVPVKDINSTRYNNNCETTHTGIIILFLSFHPLLLWCFTKRECKVESADFSTFNLNIKFTMRE
jgi:hypothetical protein